MLGQPLDPKAELLIHDRLRPHWSQAGAVVFITFRTIDSIPRTVIQRWEREKDEWLDRLEVRRCTPIRRGRAWHQVLDELPSLDRQRFYKCFNRQREFYLDQCHGACPLRRAELAEIVAASLMHFDCERYRMGDFVIMPNHVHLLAAFPDAAAMETQIGSWLRYTAVRINRLTNGRGHFWQQEPFDHLVRSPQQYQYLRDYIRDNPIKANLREGEYLYRRFED